MTKFFVYTFLLIGIVSCQLMPTRKAKKTFREHGFCYENKGQGLEQRLSLGGYYDFRFSEPSKYDTSIFNSAIVFLKDGRYFGGVGVKRKEIENKGWELAGPFIIGSADVGIYKISGDTIKVGYIYTTFAPWPKEEKWYRIIDNKNIELIACSEQYKRMEETSKEEQYEICPYVGRKYHFVPMDSIPDFKNAWIMQEKWFWCDEAAYNKFMSGRK